MKKTPLRLIVCGAAGRMSRSVAELAAADARFALAGCVCRAPGSAPHGAPQFPLSALPERLAQADALVDFTAPEATVRFAAAAAAARKAAVIGTTGLSALQRAQLQGFAKRARLFVSANFSLGVHVLGRLAREAARLLPDYDASLSEIHHARKKDEPSGTALVLAELVSRERGGRLPPIASQRAGDVVGDHTLTLAGPGERLELTHRAHSREVFARGALAAALWLAGRKPGLYGLEDMLK